MIDLDFPTAPTFWGSCPSVDQNHATQVLLQIDFVRRLAELFAKFRTGHGLVVFGEELQPLQRAIGDLLFDQLGARFAVVDDLFNHVNRDEAVDYDSDLWLMVEEAEDGDSYHSFFVAVSSHQASRVFSVGQFLEWWLDPVISQ